jgi:hypothetical protein
MKKQDIHITVQYIRAKSLSLIDFVCYLFLMSPVKSNLSIVLCKKGIGLMNQPRLSIKEALQFAFHTAIKKAPLFLSLHVISLALLLLYGIAGIAIILLQAQRLPMGTPTIVLFNPFSLLGFTFYMLIIGLYLLFIFLGIGYMNVAFDLHDTGQSSIKRLFSGLPVLLRSAFVYFLYFIATSVGRFFFIIPGLIFESTFILAAYLVVDKNYGTHAAFKESARLTRGSRLRILAITYALLGVLVLSALPSNLHPYLAILFVIPILLLTPIRILSAVYIYRRLQSTDSTPSSLGTPESSITNLVP